MADPRGNTGADRAPNEFDAAISSDIGKTKRTEARWAAGAGVAKVVLSWAGILYGRQYLPTPTTILVEALVAIAFAGCILKMMRDRSMKKGMRVTITKLEAENDRLHVRNDELVDRLTARDERSDA